MIDANSSTYKEIITFIKKIVGSGVKVFNEDALTTAPSQKEYITISIGSFVSTGQIYNSTIDTLDLLKVKSISEYRCQLYINIVGSPLFTNKNVGLISGAMQTKGFVEQFVNDLYIENETMKVEYYEVKEDGVLFKVGNIIIDSYIALEYESQVDWFDSVEDYDIDIKDGDV